jgi:NADP-dependent 3-hydroxy acid dehydrogenase YdfG
MSRFTNKIVVITGGTSGIGLAAARQFIKESAKVVVTGRNPQSIAEAQMELGANGVAIAAEIDSLFQQVCEKYGRIDVLYANAGIAKLGSVAAATSASTPSALALSRRPFLASLALPRPAPGSSARRSLPPRPGRSA